MELNTRRRPSNTIDVTCTDTGKTVSAELIKVEKDRLTVVLPGFQKLILNRSSKPGLFVANQAGMEFTARTL